MLVQQLLKVKLATAAAGRGAGDAGDSLRIDDAVVKQLFDLLHGGAATVANNVYFFVWVFVVHKEIFPLPTFNNSSCNLKIFNDTGWLGNG